MSSQSDAPLNTPALVPGVGSSYRNGWRQLRKYFLELFLIGIIDLVISSLFSFGSTFAGFRDMLSGNFAAIASQTPTLSDFLSFPYGVLIGAPLTYGVSFAYLKAARGDKLAIPDMFEGFRNYWNAVLASLLVAGIVIVGLILLIVPGIIFALKLSFTPYLVTDRKMTAIEAVKESWRMTRGHSLTIFGIGLLGIPVFIAGLIVLIVGVIPAVIWITLAGASLYYAVSLTRPSSPPAPAAKPAG